MIPTDTTTADRIYIETRLPHKAYLTVPDIAAAFGVSNHTIIAYIESGRLVNVRNLGTQTKRFFHVAREDVVRLWIETRFNG